MTVRGTSQLKLAAPPSQLETVTEAELANLQGTLEAAHVTLQTGIDAAASAAVHGADFESVFIAAATTNVELPTLASLATLNYTAPADGVYMPEISFVWAYPKKDRDIQIVAIIDGGTPITVKGGQNLDEEPAQADPVNRRIQPQTWTAGAHTVEIQAGIEDNSEDLTLSNLLITCMRVK